MASETILLEIDWDNDGTFGHASSDISADVLEIPNYDYGRDFASQLYGRSTAGSMTVVLMNDDAKYTEANTGSPIFGKILPNRRVRLKSSTNGGGSTVQWHGYLDDIIAVPGMGGMNEAVLSAFGVLAKINARKSYLGPSGTVLSGAAVTNILDSIGFPAADRIIDTGLLTMARHFVPGLWGADALQRVEETEAGFIRESRDAEIVFEDRHHRLSGAHLTSQVTYSDAAGAAIFMQSAPPGNSLKLVVNIVRAKVIRQTIASIATLWTLPETGANSPEIFPGQSITFIAQYPTPDAPTRDIGVAVWTTPAVTTDYLANSQSGGGGTNLTADVGIAVVKAVETMEITVTNNHASTIMFLTKLAARGTALQAEHEVWVQHKDTASITDFDEREYVIPAEFLPDTGQALDYCRYIAALNAQPVPMVPISYIANETQAAMDDAHARDISDRVTLTLDNLTALSIDQDMFVERKADTIDRDGVHTVRLELSDVSTGLGRVLVLDTGPGLDTGMLGYGA